MDKFISILFLGIGMIGMGVCLSMFTPLYDCKTLPSGFWDSQCKQFNSQLFFLHTLPFGLGIFSILLYVKGVRDGIAENPFMKQINREVKS